MSNNQHTNQLMRLMEMNRFFKLSYSHILIHAKHSSLSGLFGKDISEKKWEEREVRRGEKGERRGEKGEKTPFPPPLVYL